MRQGVGRAQSRRLQDAGTTVPSETGPSVSWPRSNRRARPLAYDRSRLQTATALSIYSALSTLFFGTRVITHFQTEYVGVASAGNDFKYFDASSFMWDLTWWPYALTHGLNPFVAGIIWVPDGYNMTWANGIPA